jgi:hypothetical protein
MESGFDVIGDVHGHFDPLQRLLEKMGYSRTADGVWGHPLREAVFVGDFVDRGPKQLEVLDVVRKMLSAGTAHAVMGNHEFNAIGYATEDGCGSHLRERTKKNRAQHAAFLKQVGEDSATHREAIAFFKTLPFSFEAKGLRVVHACWHPTSVATLRPYLDESGRLRETWWPMALQNDTACGYAIDVLLKGPELELPAGRSFVDKDGHERQAVRVKWWDQDATTWRRAALTVPGDEVGDLPDDPLKQDFRYPDQGAPVLFGHYWMTGEPSLSSGIAACIDFSVARPGGSLAAYRWSGERTLSPDRLVHVAATEPTSAFARP